MKRFGKVLPLMCFTVYKFCRNEVLNYVNYLYEKYGNEVLSHVNNDLNADVDFQKSLLQVFKNISIREWKMTYWT